MTNKKKKGKVKKAKVIIPYTKEEWQEIKSQREGLPYYKNQSMKAQLSDYRN